MRLAVGYATGSLSAERSKELDYYFGKPFGNEVEGRSQVVSTDVADMVEGILPSLLRIFTTSDDVVRFEPQGLEDEAAAKQQTEACNYIFYRQNPGFLVLYSWFKDALIQKVGTVKVWWEESEHRTKETYAGLSPEELALLEQNPNVEIVEREDTETGINVVLMVKDSKGKVCIAPVPPEEFGVSARHTSISLQDVDFCYHRTQKTPAELKAAGYDVSGLIGTAYEDSSQESSSEWLARRRFAEESFPEESFPSDPSTQPYWVTEAYIRIDADGDGLAELLKVVVCGGQILEKEEVDLIPFACITPIIMPHRWVGRSVAELVMDIQLTKSVLQRQMLDNLYLTNNPRKAVLASQSGQVMANLDDLLTSRPGGIVREYAPNAVRDLETPFVAGAAFPMLEYQDSLKENRTGVTRYNQGTDADSLNKTARGISAIMSASQQKIDLIARIFAETGMKDLFRAMVRLMAKYGQKPITMRLSNGWVPVDPRGWKTGFDMTVNVGLGTGTREVQMVGLEKIAAYQAMLMQSGRGHMVTDSNAYELGKRMSENLGFKHPELFLTDPRTVQKPQMPPPVDVLKIQEDQRQHQVKTQFDQWKTQFQAQLDQAVEQIRAQAQVSVAQINSQTQRELKQLELQNENQLEVYRANNKLTSEAESLSMDRMQLEKDREMFELRKQVDALIKGQQQEMAREMKEEANGGHEERAAQIMQAVTQAMGQVSAEIGGVAKLLQAVQVILGQQMDVQQQTLAAILKPKSVSIGKVERGADGQISGAVVTPTLQ